MIGVAIEESIVGVRQRRIAHIILTLLLYRSDIGVIAFLTFHHNEIVP